MIKIYQFEHEPIKRCRECPMHSFVDFPDEKDWCNLQDASISYDGTPQDNDCPLISTCDNGICQINLNLTDNDPFPDDEPGPCD